MAFPLKLETKADSCVQLQQAGPTPRVPGARGNPASLWPRPASCPSVKGSASQPGPGPALNPGNLILSKYQALPNGNSPHSRSDSVPKLQGSAQHHPRAYQTPTPLPSPQQTQALLFFSGQNLGASRNCCAIQSAHQALQASHHPEWGLCASANWHMFLFCTKLQL